MHPSNVTRRKFLTLSAAAAAGGLLARAPAARACPAIDPPPSDEARKLAAGVNAFALDLQNKLADEKGNLFFSPLSVSAALAMTSAGARGDTLKQMEKVLHLPKDPHPAYGELLGRFNKSGGPATRQPRRYEFSVANAIWAQKDYEWHKAFAELTKAHYGTGLEEIDFGESEAARKRINDWVGKETREKIKDLIPAGVISSLTRMVLANAVYFKSDWRTKFDPKQTKELPFTTADGATAKAPLMTVASEFRYAEFDLAELLAGQSPREKVLPESGDDLERLQLPIAYLREHAVQALEMPYAGGDLSMLVYLPRDPRSIRAVAALLTPGHFSPRTDTVNWSERKVNVTLPRFKVESKYTLNDALSGLGMKDAFGAADFTGMSPRGRDLFISKVLHKAFVEVNEEGSEAAAATGVVIKERVSSRPEEPATFRADRPFVYAIRDNGTGAVLFLGRYDGPR